MVAMGKWLVGGVVTLGLLASVLHSKSEPNNSKARSYYDHASVATPSYAPVIGTPPVAKNGSYYPQVSKSNGRPKTVHVDGYYRSDGTYVRGYYRSTPETTPSKALPLLKPESRPLVAENGSYYGETSKLTNLPKTTFVKGYTRKDGTYVRSHYRSRR
jgi:hypothetical protein